MADNKSKKALVDKAFEFLATPGKEVYAGISYTYLPGSMEWEFREWKRKCSVCGKLIEIPYRCVLARKPGTKWTGREVFFICADDYFKHTGKRLKARTSKGDTN